MDKLTQAFNFRHACKEFDETKKIAQDDLEFILEAGRKSPSSFGLEPWHFVVVENPELKQALRPLCYNQVQITSCSHFVIILYRKQSHFKAESPYLMRAIKRTLPEGHSIQEVETIANEIDNYFSNQLPSEYGFDRWSEVQGYIPAANMMTAAAYLQIDSCAIGGFISDKIMKLLSQQSAKIDANEFDISLCIAFGYRKHPQSKQVRWGSDDVITHL